MQTKQPVAWLANKSQDPNKERTRQSSVNSKIDSKMTQDTQCVDKIMEAKYQWTRMLGTKYDYPNIMTCQQSHDKEWVQWPSKHMMKDSKIGVQGALDMILFITQPEEASKEAQRFLCAPKNKLSLEGQPTLRMECRFNKALGLYYEE